MSEERVVYIGEWHESTGGYVCFDDMDLGTTRDPPPTIRIEFLQDANGISYWRQIGVYTKDTPHD